MQRLMSAWTSRLKNEGPTGERNASSRMSSFLHHFAFANSPLDGPLRGSSRLRQDDASLGRLRMMVQESCREAH